MVDARDVVSTDLKGAGHRLALLALPTDDALVPEYDKALMLYESLHQAILRGDVLSGTRWDCMSADCVSRAWRRSAFWLTRWRFPATICWRARILNAR